MSIRIVRGNIVDAECDAVVNAANEHLMRGSGVCGAIFASVDSVKLKAACDEVGYTPAGSAAVTPSFGLDAKYIIHAVGPVWRGGDKGEYDILRRCYINALEAAGNCGASSVAFPLISAGVFGFPIEAAWETALFACRNSPLDICFMVLDDRILEAGLRILGNMNKKIVCFDNDNGLFECFSNWYRAPFKYAGRQYSSIETYMMIQKVEMFGEYELAEKIEKADDASEAKRIGRTQMERFDAALWAKAGYSIVKRGVRAKFEQYPEFAEILKQTEGMEIAECNADDRIWGIGIGLDDDRRYDRRLWNGTNRLGRILMEVREELKSGLSYVDIDDLPFDRIWDIRPSDLEGRYADAAETYRITLDYEQKYVFDTSRFGDMQNLPKAGFREMLQEICDIWRQECI
ncbi:MAG: NADAR domain-containing protein [Anaerovoracaceae bacterium]|nr:NADAR domain-containing protein [Anaerovoracaceae bacterium]